MRVVFAAGSSAIAVALAIAWGCLPDLTIPAPAVSTCGDGFIDPDAGEECDPGASLDPDAGDAGWLAGACVHCKVACAVAPYPSFEDPATQHCYFQPAVTAASTDAIDDCEASGGHVVRFVSEAELTLVAAEAGATPPFWIGISREAAGEWRPFETTYEPGFATDCLGCFAQVDAGTIPPDVTNGKCVAGTRDLTASWTGSPCAVAATTKGFDRQTICEREPVGSRARACGGNVCLTVAATASAKSYAIVPGADGGLDSNGALLGCAALGGRLAVLGSSEEREQVGYEIGRYFGGATTTWIGLSDVNGTWGWDLPDAGGMVTPPWGIAEPGTVDGGSGRAYLAIDATRTDSELAHAGNATGELHAALCEIP